MLIRVAQNRCLVLIKTQIKLSFICINYKFYTYVLQNLIFVKQINVLLKKLIFTQSEESFLLLCYSLFFFFSHLFFFLWAGDVFSLLFLNTQHILGIISICHNDAQY